MEVGVVKKENCTFEDVRASFKRRLSRLIGWLENGKGNTATWWSCDEVFSGDIFIHESSTLCLLRDLIYGRLSICMRFGFLTLAVGNSVPQLKSCQLIDCLNYFKICYINKSNC